MHNLEKVLPVLGVQVKLLQAAISVPVPRQATPVLVGIGLLQGLVLSWNPSPQLALHVPQEDQEPQVESSKKHLG